MVYITGNTGVVTASDPAGSRGWNAIIRALVLSLSPAWVLVREPVLLICSVYLVTLELPFPQFTCLPSPGLIWATETFCMRFGSRAGVTIRLLFVLGRPLPVRRCCCALLIWSLFCSLTCGRGLTASPDLLPDPPSASLTRAKGMARSMLKKASVTSSWIPSSDDWVA